MADLPPPDLLDHRGRLNRIVIALVAAVVAGAIAYTIIYARAGADSEHGDRGAWRAIYYVTGFAFAGTFVAVHKILTAREKRRWADDRVPRATIER